ncbi:unnamed protein product [Protopolystoma xenopodis]|uniref:Uncharacterized protein n=1 Tax=Protopolystoma xenopodis TaxID=117903 RepID=A0A3S5BB78_9PLAT|nr:unnamed protein product [Protopolystoma xenopodis]
MLCDWKFLPSSHPILHHAPILPHFANRPYQKRRLNRCPCTSLGLYASTTASLNAPLPNGLPSARFSGRLNAFEAHFILLCIAHEVTEESFNNSKSHHFDASVLSPSNGAIISLPRQNNGLLGPTETCTVVEEFSSDPANNANDDTEGVMAIVRVVPLDLPLGHLSAATSLPGLHIFPSFETIIEALTRAGVTNDDLFKMKFLRGGIVALVDLNGLAPKMAFWSNVDLINVAKLLLCKIVLGAGR